MPRPPRLQIAGGIYHLTARGNRRQPIFLDDRDFHHFLELLAMVVERYGWICHAYCLMPNHYHLVIETPAENLSAGLQLLNSQYAQWFNARHEYSGHLFQGRFHSVLVANTMHLVQLARYVMFNPVRAGLCETPGTWRWSSYLATAGGAGTPPLLSPDWLVLLFGRDIRTARAAFAAFVAEASPQARPP